MKAYKVFDYERYLQRCTVKKTTMLANALLAEDETNEKEKEKA